MEDQQKTQLTKWVRMLIESELPKGISENAIQQYLSFSMRLLSSRLGSTPSIDERMVRNQLMRQPKQSQQQLKIQELLQKFDRFSNGIENKPAILQLLYKLSESGDIKVKFDNLDSILKTTNNNSNGSNINNSHITNGGGQMQSSFVKQQNTGMKEQQNQYGNVTMEIEANTTMNTLGNSQQTQLNPLLGQTQRSLLSQNNKANNPQAQQFLQTVKRLQNKGNPSIDLTENDLIRDLIYAFQAIDGHYIVYDNQSDRFMLKTTIPVAEPVRELVNKLCILGDLFRKIQMFLMIEPQGQICQALHQAIRDELNEYYRLIAIFENELNLQCTIDGSSSNSNNNSYSLTNSAIQQNASISNTTDNSNNPMKTLTLRKLQLWVIEPQERLKWLAIICDATKSITGFSVISSLNAYETQGSPPIQQLISRILQNIVQPFIKYVNQWIYNGELHDPFGEFFVRESISESDIWNMRYSLEIKQIPNIIDKADAQMIFNIGRSVNFLHKACKSAEWKLNLSPCDLKVIDRKSFDVFKSWIKQASIMTNDRIVSVMVERYKLKQHLHAIKQFLLMGQGDFVQQLMDLLAEQLTKNANEIHRHNLLGSLESAIRSSNAVNSENHQRLDIKLLEASPGDKGWDIFSLDYHVEPPLDTILSPNIMRNYLKIFNFLWRVRRVNHCLSQVWVDHMKQASIFQKESTHRNNNNNNNHNTFGSHDPVNVMMKKFHVLRSQMTHFVNNLTCYVMVDAIETTYKQFLDDLDKIKDFSEIISIHRQFVDSVLDKALLTEKNMNIYRQLNSLFTLIIKFRNTQLVILTEMQEEHERVREVRNQNAQRRLIGEDIDDQEELDQEDFRLPPTAKAFNQLAASFQKSFGELLMLLKKEDKLRFLSFKLDFNEYYSAKQTESLGVFSENQLAKYSATGLVKMANFKTPQIGLQNNNNNNQSSFSSINIMDQSPFNKQSGASFTVPNSLNNTLLGNNNNSIIGQNTLKQQQQNQQVLFNQQQQLQQPQVSYFKQADMAKDNSFISNSSSNLKNSGFIKREGSFNDGSNNSNNNSIRQLNNINSTNGNNQFDARPPIAANTFFSKTNSNSNNTNDFFKPSSLLGQKINSQEKQQQLSTTNNNNNKLTMEEEYDNGDDQVQQQQQQQNQFNNNNNYPSTKNNIGQSAKNLTAQDLFAKNTKLFPLTTPPINNFFQGTPKQVMKNYEIEKEDSQQLSSQNNKLSKSNSRRSSNSQQQEIQEQQQQQLLSRNTSANFGRRNSSRQEDKYNQEQINHSDDGNSQNNDREEQDNSRDYGEEQ